MKRTKIKYLFIVVSLIVLFSIGQADIFSTEGSEKNQELINDERIESKKIVGYYPAWKAYSGYTPDKVDVSKLTHINYAFANIDNNLKITMGYPDIDESNFKKLNELKKINPELKILISVGGWNWSGKFSLAAATEESREIFADSCAEFISKYNLDGVDLDWEYPVGGGLETNHNSPHDKENFTLLLKKIREKLNDRELIDNKKYILSIAAGASNYYINNTEVNKFQKYLDYVTLMTYDIHGPWDLYSDFNSPLYNNNDESRQYKISVDSSVKAWLNAGLPKEKLIVGIPFYGYKYHVTTDSDRGLYGKHTEGSALSYHTIVTKYLNNPIYTRYFHEESLVPWLYDGKTFISYDDPKSIALKAEYIKDQNLGGAMIWELSQDSEGALLSSLHSELYGDIVLIVKDYKGHWAEEIIEKWMNSGYIKGYPDGQFKPEEFVTRAEFICMVNTFFKFTERGEIKFTDVGKDSWYYEEVEKAYKAGYIIGISETEFAPEKNITREEAATIVYRLLNLQENKSSGNIFTDSYLVSDWAKGYVKAAAENKIIKGYEDNSFRPQKNIKRGEALLFLDRALNFIDYDG